MTQHFKIFATKADYDAYIAGEHATPLVAYISATGKCILPEGSGGGGNQLLKSIDIDDFTGTAFNGVARYITEATIPAGVTSIGDDAFYNCGSLTSVTIPNSVTSFGSYAFGKCTGLTSVTIPDAVTRIGANAFNGCTGLTSVTIPDAVTRIGAQAFLNCTALTSVTIPNSVTIVGDRTFVGCTGLTSVEIPDSVTIIGAQAFADCSALTSFTVRATTPPTLYSAAFLNTNDTFIIYVPAASVEAYKAASGWSDYASQIQAITE